MDRTYQAIGRSKTVLVFGDGPAAKAVVAEVAVRLRRSTHGKRLTFKGSVCFESQAVEHLSNAVIPVLDELARGLGLKQRSFDISIVNLGAASVQNLGMTIDGNSAEAAIFLAAFSAMLRIAVPGDIVTTGHLASPQGDVRPVRDIPVKLAAAISEPGVGRFICPALDTDRSLPVLLPGEMERADGAMRQASEKIRVITVAGVHQLLRAAINDESVVLASLEIGFYGAADQEIAIASSIETAVAFLVRDNERRFWDALGWSLRLGGTETSVNVGAKRLLVAWGKYHASQRRYPSGFGRRLLQLVMSLPPAVRRLKGTFPLMTLRGCLAVCRYAGDTDGDDVRYFLEAVAGKASSKANEPASTADPVLEVSANAIAAAEAVLSEISQENLAQKIGLPIDTARAGYVAADATLESKDDFFDLIAGFYSVLLYQTGYLIPGTDGHALQADATALLGRAFADRGGLAAARAEAKWAVHGGIRLILDAMTDQHKAEQQEKHVSRVLKEAIDPLNWEEQVAFAGAVLQKIRPQLPPELQGMPLAQIAKSIEAIILAYVRSMDRVRELLRTL